MDGATRSGTISGFDDPRGIGTVRGDDGTEYPFHCTRIADGTRSIDPDARVTFVVVAGHMGRWEADVIARV